MDKAKILELSKQLTFMSDVFSRNIFGSEGGAVQEIINAIFAQKIVIDYVSTQANYKPNEYNKGYVLDILAKSNQYCFDIEIQNKTYKTIFEQALNYLHTICYHFNPIKSIKTFNNINAYYRHVIYLIKGDVFKKGKNLYQFRIKSGLYVDQVKLDCDSIVFVDVTKQDVSTPLGMLCHDMCQTNAEDMYLPELKKLMQKARKKEWSDSMCEIFEAYAKEVHHELMEINEKQKQEFETISEKQKQEYEAINIKQKQEYEAINIKQKQEYEAINIKQKQEYEEKIVTLMLSMGTYDMNEIRKYSTLNQDEIKAIADRLGITLKTS